MKTMLIIPPKRKTKDDIQTGNLWPRIGIAYVAGYLRHSGSEIRIVDALAEELNQQQITELIEQFEPDVVGLGPFTEEILETYSLVRQIKAVKPDTVTVLGGPHASAVPERTLRECAELDLVVRGEGELTMSDVAAGNPFQSLSGVAYRSNGQIVMSRPAEQLADIDTLPYPAWDLFPLERYRGLFIHSLYEQTHSGILELPILSARGCPYKCVFCFKTYSGLRARKSAAVVDEIQYNVDKYGAREFFFVEGTFADSRDQGAEICDEIIARGLNRKIRWSASTRVNVINEELLAKMKEASCLKLQLGVESGDPEILKRSHKGITLPMAYEAMRLTRKIGIKTTCFFIIGHPGESRESIKKTYKFARRLNADEIAVGIMVPYPGTQVRQMAENGQHNLRLLSDDWSEYSKQMGGSLELESIPLAELRRIHRIEYLKYYLRPRQIRHLLTYIPLKKLFMAARAMLRSIIIPNK